MRLTVSHTTRYTYATPQKRIVQSHRLTPVRHDGQTPLDWTVAAEGAKFGAGFTDGAGDLVSTMTIAGPLSELTITVAGTIETRDTAGILRGHRETIAPEVYLRRTRTTAPGVALQALADGIDATKGALDAAHQMAALVSETIEYVPGQTHSAMTASEVVELGKGVCQDQAQVLIAVARIRGVPARYVTGYMWSEGDDAMSQASHAWAELHVPDLGWVGFDPANECCPDDRYIRLGSGFDAADAAPIRGIALGETGEAMDVAVSVAQAQQ